MYVYTYAAMYESFLLSCSRPDQHPNLEFRFSPTKQKIHLKHVENIYEHWRRWNFRVCPNLVPVIEGTRQISDTMATTRWRRCDTAARHGAAIISKDQHRSLATTQRCFSILYARYTDTYRVYRVFSVSSLYVISSCNVSRFSLLFLIVKLNASNTVKQIERKEECSCFCEAKSKMTSKKEQQEFLILFYETTERHLRESRI